MDISTSVLKGPSVSSIRRRKPMYTYQSPSPGDRPPTVLSVLSRKLASTSASTSASTATPKTASGPIVVHTGLFPRKKYPMAPPLPLYHPLSRLALSLPPLDPSSFGHSAPISIDDSESGRRSSARSRRPAAKLREAEDDDPPSVPAPISNVSAIAAVAAREIKEKLSPRKKRAGGAKRKRKDLDDSDATYPAKRTTRNPRGAGNALDEGSPSDSVVPLPEVTPTPEPVGELQDDSKRPERRSTRSSGVPRRRDSTASSASASAGSRGASKVNATETKNVDPDAEMVSVGDVKEAKEEGEVSEEAP
ncbi:hypothetical protein B0H17DRAFT_152694 [Mycena rosella]|uniref:Uncharacterized protein n=1 Tax=Mycena rosella TaxID=1033263 RepID=A0AAD7GBV8_MYCRO|nr:hypothetical protein B0H17DRAFT_152694 [Mycena rosella]